MTAKDAGTPGTVAPGAEATGAGVTGAVAPGAPALGTGTAGVPAARPPVLAAGTPGEGVTTAAAPPRAGGVARAAGVTAGLSVAGSVAGLVRDQAIARLFGAGARSDAFLVAWTVPEIAATVLIEDAMALVMVPAFSAALARAAGGAGPRDLVRGTLPRLVAVLAALTAALAAAAPYVVDVLAPGLADPGTAVACTRLTALTVLGFGAAGYLSAALRAHRHFVPPAAIYVAYNAGIVTTLFALHGRLGVRAAAAGVAVGAVCMVAIQLPAFLRALYGPSTASAAGTTDTASATGTTGTTSAATATADATASTDADAGADARTGSRRRSRIGGPGPADPGAAGLGAARPEPAAPGPAGPGPARPGPGTRAGIGAALLAPVVLFTLGRQAQVLVERFFAAPLPAGAISHLNYAQKVAQLPMALSLMVCTVTFPAVSRALATGDRAGARRRVERDLGLACLVVLLGAAYVVACAPQIIHVLFQRGEFDAADSAATAGVMRVYALGLLGQSLVGALVRPYFSAARPTWYPAAAMGAGLLVTAVADAAAAGPWGAYGIAAGNAAGITVAAALLLRGLAAHPLALRGGALAPALARTAAAALAATAAGWAVAARMPGPVSGAAAGAFAVATVFAGVAAAAGVPEARPRYLLALVTRKARR